MIVYQVLFSKKALGILYWGSNHWKGHFLESASARAKSSLRIFVRPLIFLA